MLQIVVMDKLDYCATLNNLKEIKDLPNFRFVKGSIQSLDLVSHILESEEIDTVMHFAAQVRLRLCCQARTTAAGTSV
jgi:dTDP-D-glucose 4,6-dehydratase